MSDANQTESGDLAPELHNDEQDPVGTQAQDVAEEALLRKRSGGSPTESTKPPHSSGLDDDSTQDLVDHMRDMESSGRIDMSAFRGEPNHDDEDETYGPGHDPDEDD